MTLNNETFKESPETYVTAFDVRENVTNDVNVTSSKMTSPHDIHLWLPHVVLTLVLVAMAVASFVKYHYKNKVKYREKLEAAKMKTNKPFKKYRVKLGGRGLGDSESKCAGVPVQNGISHCRSDSKGSGYKKWMDLDVRSFAQNHTHDLMVKQSPAHSQAVAYSFNNLAFESSTSDCDVVNSDYDLPGYNDILDSSDVKVTELNSSDDNSNVRIDDFLKNLGMYTEFDKSDIDDEPSFTKKRLAYARDSSTGYRTSTMATSGDSFGLDTDTGTECGTVSTINVSNRDSFVSFDSDQTYDARSQEARMAGYNSLGDTDDGVARVFVSDFDSYNTDTDYIETDNDRENTDTDTDRDTIYQADDSIRERDTETEMETISQPPSTSPESTGPFDGIVQTPEDGASYDLPPGVRNRNQETVHVTAL